MRILSFLGDISSILGFIITCFVFFVVRNIRAYYNLIGRVPNLKRELEKRASQLIDLKKDYSNNIREIDLELAKAEPILVRLKRKLGRKNNSATKSVIQLVKAYRKRVKNNTASALVEDVTTIYTEMQKVIVEISELKKDIEWER
jgi:DNA repair ATPase RecN